MWTSGRVSGKVAWDPSESAEADSDEQAAFMECVRKHEAQKSVLSDLLGSDDCPDLREWALRLEAEDISDIPSSLRRPIGFVKHSGLVVPDPHTPITTEWQPLPAKSGLEPRLAPQGPLSAVRRHKCTAAA